MRCEEAVEILRATEHAGILPLQAARAHLEGCEDCAAALRAVSALRAEHYAPAPRVPAQSFARPAIRRLSRRACSSNRSSSPASRRGATSR